MDTSRLSRFVGDLWDAEIVPQLVEYIRIPNKSPMFDKDWASHGYMDAAVKLMEFLASDEAQKIYATANNEYPVGPGVHPSAIVAGWGTLKADPLPLDNIGKYRKRASELVDKVNFDAGPSS